MSVSRSIGPLLAGFFLTLGLALPAAADYLSRPFADDTMYFLVLDRFAKHEGDGAGLPGTNPANARFFHGGNLKAAAEKLDYIKGLGATAIWMTPIFVNQTFSAHHPEWPDSTGYHGYWILDFLHVDPHFGTEEDLRTFIAEAHKRDIKVFFDIVVNHTGDVIKYRECEGTRCPYRAKADFPYSRRAADGKPINPGFLGDSLETEENFAKLTDMSYAYTPYIPAGQEHARNPDWLNDLRSYHNRGFTTFKGESATYGDFGGLDDVFTENPRVVQGFIEIYEYWIEKFHIDGYRIDTARHVNVEFWQKFNPAILDFAKSRGIPNFFIFGEVADFSDDSAMLAQFTREAKFPGALDFAFTDEVTRIASGQVDASVFTHIFQADTLFEGGKDGAANQPTFVSNHDDGRLAYKIRKFAPAMPADEVQARVRLAHALMFFARGVPILYYGDEQGFMGSGDDSQSRQDMFPTKVSAYAEEEKLGASGGGDHFDPHHPLYQAFAEMGALRNRFATLRRGQFVLRPNAAQGLITFSRLDPATGEEFLIAVNTTTAPRDSAVEVGYGAMDWQGKHGVCSARASSPGSYQVSVPALDYLVCHSPNRTTPGPSK
jgi:glycosidase